MTKASLFSILIPLLLSISLQSIFAFTPYKDPVTQVGKTGPAIVIYNNGSTQGTSSTLWPMYQTPKPTPTDSKTPSTTRPSTTASIATPLNEGDEGDEGESNPKKTPSAGTNTGGALDAQQGKKKSNNIGIYIGVGIAVIALLAGVVGFGIWYRARQLRRFSRMPAHTWKMLNNPNNNRRMRRVDSELLEPPPLLPEVRTSNSSWHRYVSTVWTSRNNSNVNISQQESHRPSELQDVVLRS